MKNLLLILSSLLLLTFSVQAQKPGNKPSWKERQQQQAAQLQLSEQQQQQWNALLEQFDSQFQAIKDEASKEKSDQKTKSAALRKQYTQQRNAILTATQRQQLKQMNADKKADKNADSKGGKGKRGNRQNLDVE